MGTLSSRVVIFLLNRGVMDLLNDPTLSISDAIRLESSEDLIDRVLPYNATAEQYSFETAMAILVRTEGTVAAFCRYSSEEEFFADAMNGDVAITEETEDDGMVSIAYIKGKPYFITVRNGDYLYALDTDRNVQALKRRWKLKPIEVEVPLANSDRPTMMTQSIHTEAVQTDWLSEVIQDKQNWNQPGGGRLLRMEQYDTVEFYEIGVNLETTNDRPDHCIT